MKITELKCTACNGTLKIDKENPHIAVCEYCQTRYIIEDDDSDNVQISPEPEGIYYSKSEPEPYTYPKITGWEAYGWKRILLLSMAGVAILAAIQWKSLANRYRDSHETSIKVTEGYTIPGMNQEEGSFRGIFADMAEGVFGIPASELTEEELSKIQWVEMKYQSDTIQIGYSFDNPYETDSASLQWVFLPREGAGEEFDQLKRFTGLKKLNIPGYVSPEVLKSLPLEGLGCYAKSPSELTEAVENPGAFKEVLFQTGIKNLEGLSLFTNLEKLTINGSELTDIKDLANMKSLKSLTLMKCDHITDFSVLGVMPWLEELSVESEGIRDIGFLSGLTSLKVLTLKDTEVLNVNVLSKMPGLHSLTIEDCGRLKDISGIEGVRSLTSLALEIPNNCPQPDLSGLTGLTSLFIRGSKDLSFLKSLNGLEKLSLYGCQIDSGEAFSSLNGLKELECSHIYGDLTGWGFVNQLSGLEVLNLRGVSTYEDISGLFNIPTLKTLSVSGMECEIKFDRIGQNDSITTLEMDGMKLYTNVKVSGNGGITYVDYDKVALDQHTDFLKNLKGLEHLSLAGNTLTQLSFIPELVNLKTLDIQENYVTDLKPLESLTNLKQVNCTGNPVENYRVIDERVIVIK